jgi:hypothetical protein
MRILNIVNHEPSCFADFAYRWDISHLKRREPGVIGMYGGNGLRVPSSQGIYHRGCR